MKTIIRIENPEDGCGIHVSLDSKGTERKFSAKDLSNSNEFIDRHWNFPTPTEESLYPYKDNKKWFCAFKSVDQLQQWVYKPEIKEFVDMGFKVLLLDVTEYQEGKYQIIYTKESIVQSKDITKLFL